MLAPRPPFSRSLVVAPQRTIDRAWQSTAAGAMAALGVGMGVGACIANDVGSMVVALLAVVAIVAVWIASVRLPQLQLGRARRERARRELARRRALQRAPLARRQQYEDLRRLVDDMERADSREADRLQLQQLLDQFVRLATSHQGFVAALRIAGEASAMAPRNVIAARRIRHRHAVIVKLAQIADDLEATAELVRWIAQRIAIAELDAVPELDLEWRLSELDHDASADCLALTA